MLAGVAPSRTSVAVQQSRGGGGSGKGASTPPPPPQTFFPPPQVRSGPVVPAPPIRRPIKRYRAGRRLAARVLHVRIYVCVGVYPRQFPWRIPWIPQNDFVGPVSIPNGCFV